MKFIAIETITDICSISLFNSDKKIDLLETSEDFAHSKNLPLLFNKIIKKNKISISSLQFVAISIGPGSYTGIKIGVNFTKGLAYSLNIPIVPVNSIDSLNFSINQKGKYYIALFSHKNYIFYQEFKDGLVKSKQICDKVLKLNEYKIFGYQLSNIGKIKYNKIQPSSLNIGYYAIENYKKFATKDYGSKTSICLSKVN